jgi:hypothetical protein
MMNDVPGCAAAQPNYEYRCRTIDSAMLSRPLFVNDIMPMVPTDEMPMFFGGTRESAFSTFAERKDEAGYLIASGKKSMKVGS